MKLGKKKACEKWCGSYGELLALQSALEGDIVLTAAGTVLAEDAALLFGRMVGYTHTHLQKRRRVEEILTCRKVRVLRFYVLNRGICAECVYSLVRALNLLNLAGCRL